MYGRLTILILITIVSTSFRPGSPGEPLHRIIALYHRSDDLFHLNNNTPATDSIALAGFTQVIDELRKAPALSGGDTLLFQSWLKKGVLLDSKLDYTGARDAYCQALGQHRQNDSSTFVAQVYAGACYYNLNNFDSASYFLLRAEPMAGQFRDQDDQVRLYNTLGVLYHDNGNYQQGKNYFERALGIVNAKKPFDTASAVSLQTNIATCYFRLGLFRQSLEMYHKTLSYHIFADAIYVNMGLAYISLQQYGEAMRWLHKVSVKALPSVLNEMGRTQILLQRPDSAMWFLDRFAAIGQKFPVNQLDLGINDLYRADLLAERQQYQAALSNLQKAIIIFTRNFSNEAITSNPSNFTGTFATYRLFEALYKKAVIFERLYRADPKEAWLTGSYEAYKAALSLLRYIEKNYDTDDAKLFLKKKNSEVYQGAMAVCLGLYHLHPSAHYLEEAFLISEKNKASVITANLEERAFTKIPGAAEGLLQRQRNIKYNIARLNVRSDNVTNQAELEKIAAEKAGYEIELSRLQNKLEENSAYYQLKYDDASPGVRELQTRLDRDQALISFSAAGAALHVFVVTADSFAYARIDSLPRLQEEVSAWLTLLQTTGNGKKFRGDSLGESMNRQLIRPILALVPGKDEWIVVPDGFLFFLPLESLPSGEAGKTLLETTTISYEFAARFVGGMEAGGIERLAGTASHMPVTVLAFAPFAGGGTARRQGPGSFSPLPASREEISGLAGLGGREYTDSAATKERFLSEINKYPIVHLATHAVSSINDAAASYIAFYPQHDSALEDRLFLEELYGLDMHATQLVIMSACETGQGELVNNEGVISLARAFAYAGCASTISSLWKADDQATSFILRRFYIYLEKGYTKSKALRQAKLDYLGSDAINKSPAYWSHLILMGNAAPVYTKRHSWLLLLLLLLPLGSIWWWFFRKTWI